MIKFLGTRELADYRNLTDFPLSAGDTFVNKQATIVVLVLDDRTLVNISCDHPSRPQVPDHYKFSGLFRKCDVEVKAV